MHFFQKAKEAKFQAYVDWDVSAATWRPSR
jgi:hypothetical protein